MYSRTNKFNTFWINDAVKSFRNYMIQRFSSPLLSTNCVRKRYILVLVCKSYAPRKFDLVLVLLLQILHLKNMGRHITSFESKCKNPKMTPKFDHALAIFKTKKNNSSQTNTYCFQHPQVAPNGCVGVNASASPLHVTLLSHSRTPTSGSSRKLAA